METVLMRSLCSKTAVKLHRVQTLGKNHADECYSAEIAFGRDAVLADFDQWCDTPEAKAAEWPVTAYLRIINQRLAPKIVLPPTPISDSRRTSGVAISDKQTRAMSWLKDFLLSGPKLAVDLLREGAAAGHSDKILYWVFDRMGGIKSRKDGRTIWELPVDESTELIEITD